MNSCFLAIGTNLGERHENLNIALRLVVQFATIISKSQPFENSALLPPNAPQSWNIDFLNIALHIQTNLSAFQVLQKIKEIESLMGRNQSSERWSPRVIDIDIIFFNNLILQNEILEIPHSQMHKRDFVLIPMHNIAPNYTHPVLQKTIKTLNEELPHQGQS